MREHEVPLAEVEVCLSAHEDSNVLPLSYKRPLQNRNSFLARGVAVNRKPAIKHPRARSGYELEPTQTQMAQKPMLRAEVGMRVRCANKASAE